MRRQLTAREKILLGLFFVILVVSGYILLFYTPMRDQRDSCLSQAESCWEETEVFRARLADKIRMEQEMEAQTVDGEPLVSIPDYDNLQPVIFELNNILAGTNEYSLSFTTVDAAQTIVRRSISLSYRASGYAAARLVLQQLHDSAFRCMLDNLSMSFEEEEGDAVSVTGTIIFFEYQKEPPVVSEPGPEEAV